MQNQVLVVLGADSELMLCWVEDVQQQMTLAGAVEADTKTEYGCMQDMVTDHIKHHTQTHIKSHYFPIDGLCCPQILCIMTCLCIWEVILYA